MAGFGDINIAAPGTSNVRFTAGGMPATWENKMVRRHQTRGWKPAGSTF